ncbi:type II/IV secretion system ATPase subunit [Candidatus Woesearchaeota archaeon]|nr:type II/IV secretion system ATPase subunit [Candidatus Woesearchaeota archaeon]
MAEKKDMVFQLDTRPRRIDIPDFEKREEINIRYPLLPPYAFAHIFWDDSTEELVYHLEEPVLDSTEKEVLRLVMLGLEEMINISFTRAAKKNALLDYLEKNVQSILLELGTKVSEESYKKIMYYIYRDSIGLNRIEPLMHDYFIEDIECNGKEYPLYIVHRKFENIRTNIIYTENQELTDFVEKLAQKSNKYISYAKPLLDATLPDGSRVNATYTEDITTRGPTFTIRKFTKEPWTPAQLINFNTASPEAFAYLWLAIENKLNIMVIGETASGKTTFLNSILHFIPPEARVCSIEDTRELNLAHANWLPSVTRVGMGIPNQEGSTYGEISLFDLLRESFRQNPDYVIVGEIRGKEAYVLFQGMASGHPSFGTFHAGSVETLVRRLQTPPINLPASLVESLNIVCIVSHVKTRDKNIRRLKEVAEIVSIEDSGKIQYNKLFEWDAQNDKVVETGVSYILEKISKNSGQTIPQLKDEIQRRAKLLKSLEEKKIFDYRKINMIINKYYQNPVDILKEHGIM